MVAAIELPNIRKQFVPDPGYLIVDMDLSGADAQVVAWEADDKGMKDAFRAGMKIHVKNTRDMWPEWADATDEEIKNAPVYKQNKIFCHATNYVGSAGTIATNTHWPVAFVADFQRKWFELHPGIKDWHTRTGEHLDGSRCWNCNFVPDGGQVCPNCGKTLGRTVKNAFGYRRIYFDWVDKILPEAIAWIPQSTVAHVTMLGMFRLRDNFDFAKMLLQVHDSIVFQIPKSEESALKDIKTELDAIEVPYPDPLYIPWGVAVSDETWGHCG